MSDVKGTEQTDHAVYAANWLKDHGFDEEWESVVADDQTLMLDYDDDSPVLLCQEPPRIFYDILEILRQRYKVSDADKITYSVHSSKGGNTHVVVRLPKPMPMHERSAWQAAFGSDRKREALHLLSVHKNELNPILLYMRKDRQ